jgi:ATP-dependent DNA helicase RecQ
MTETDLRQEATEALRALVGDPSAEFRDGQLEAISALVADRRRVLVVQRTGWGKSAVYFVTTALLRARGAGPTLLVSPLLGLMRNQIEAAERGGIRAATINSDNQQLWDEVTEQLEANTVDLLLVSPERFANPGFRERVLPTVAPRAGLLVIDEVHCISDWGHDFRPDYRRLARVLDLLPRGVPVLGTTATANDRVVADVQAQLGEELLTIRGPLDREALALDAIELRSQTDRLAWLAQVLPTLDGTGIVYTLTVTDAHRVAAWLRSQGIEARAYTGETDTETKLSVESDLLANNVKAVVATSALGMGYDKPDLAFVVHYQSPGSVIAYYQQVGRAGRGIARAEGILLSGHEDADIQDWFIRTAFPDRDDAEAVVRLLADAGDWVPIHQIEDEVNVRRSRLESMLKNLEVDGAVEREGRKYRRTLAPWTYDEARVKQVTAQRRREQATMRAYLHGDGCLMETLRRQLDDPTAEPCGRCSRCTGESRTIELDRDLVIAAQEFLRGQNLALKPRKQYPAGTRIAAGEQLADGWALATVGDGGWGPLIDEGRRDGKFADELVDALAELLRKQHPDEPFAWVTAVPSRRAADLVPSLAERLADRLGLPFRPVLTKVRDTAPQAEMQNSAQQASNVGGAFAVTEPIPDSACLLVDDVWDSGWTLTVVAQLLRSHGSGPVYGAVLAQAT